MKKMICLLIAAACFCGLSAQKLPATLTMQDGTTRTGIVKLPKPDDKGVDFQADREAKGMEIPGSQIVKMAITYTDGITLEYDFLPVINYLNVPKGNDKVTEERWLQALVRGYATLYVFQTQGTIRYNPSMNQQTTTMSMVRHFCRRTGEAAASEISTYSQGSPVPNMAFIKVGPVYFADDAQLVEKIKNKEVKYKDLEQIVQEYNATHGPVKSISNEL